MFQLGILLICKLGQKLIQNKLFLINFKNYYNTQEKLKSVISETDRHQH